MKQRTFLTAEWKNLLMLNYVVEPAMLEPLVPFGTELDSFDGHVFVSLIGFEFNRTRIGGKRVPFHQSFEEVNLRFYVRRANQRGVVFIRELVPKRAVVAVARVAFGENYSCAPMSHSFRSMPESNVVEAEYTFGSGRDRCSMRIETTANAPTVPEEYSLGQFITEHYWGYAAQKGDTCIEYEVQHPQWRVREAAHAEFVGDASAFYGEEFARIVARPADSAFLAEGSEVTVFKGRRIKNKNAEAVTAG